MKNGIAWQNAELIKQENSLVDTFKAAGMTVITPDPNAFRAPVMAKVPKMFESKWGAGHVRPDPGGPLTPSPFAGAAARRRRGPGAPPTGAADALRYPGYARRRRARDRHVRGHVRLRARAGRSSATSSVDPLTWSDELARYLFVWCAFLGWVIAARRRSHLAIGSLPQRASPRVRALLALLAAVAALAFAAHPAYLRSADRARNCRRRDDRRCSSRMGVVYAIVPLAALAVGLHALADARRRVRALSDPTAAAR